jgi:hypothetical protein
MKDIDYYEPRYLRKTNEKSIDFFFETKNNTRTLKESIFEFDKVILLGNPGIGKTKELEKLFDNLWDEKDTSGLIPFSINLKNFRKTNNFEDLIPYKNWAKDFPEIIFILDGLDEIAEIPDFLSAFETFITQNKLINIKYVLSCRTNIYDKYLVNIPNFETFFLDDLTPQQDESILKNKYGIELKTLNLDEKHLNYLKTPFFLKLFAEYYLEKNKTPQSDSEIWDLYVGKAIDHHITKQLKKVVLNKPKLINELKKVAFVNELMQKNYVTEDELFNTIGNDYLSFIENPFINELKGDFKKWNFEHRQIQEYFVAKTLQERTFEEIIKIIRIPNLEKTPPSLFNTISFLINLLDKKSELFTKLISWVETNQIELLFRADSDRITNELRIRLFQKYFQTECIDKTFWIDTNRTFSIKEIAKFSDCEVNYEYLLNIIKSNEHHFRVVISAIKLLRHFRIQEHNRIKLKPDLIGQLENPTVDLQIKSQIINFINALELCKNDNSYLAKIFNIFKTESNKELNNSLLALLVKYDDIDHYYEYIKEEFLRENDIIKRAVPDNVHRGNDRILESLIIRFKNYDYFFDIISYYFGEHYHIYSPDTFEEKILAKFLGYIKDNPEYIISFFDKINSKTKYFERRKLLLTIILKSNTQFQIVKYLLENNPFSQVSYFLAHIVQSDSLKLIAEKYKEGKINDSFEGFRNLVANTNSRKLAEEFNNMMLEAGFKFIADFMNEEELNKVYEKQKTKPQENFNILFDKEGLLAKIQDIFDEDNEEIIDKDKIIEIENNWYKIHGHWNTVDTSINLLRTLIYDYNRPLSFERVVELLGNDFNRFKKIKNSILRNDTNTDKFEITLEQKNKIIDWCKDSASKIQFDKVIILHNSNSFTTLFDFEILKTVLFFYDRFEFVLPQEFLLNCIQFVGMENSDNNDKWDKLFEKINDQELFNKKIVENIISKTLFSIVLSKHVDYAIKNNLQSAFQVIREYLKEGSIININDEIFEHYIELSRDYKLLEECCVNIHDSICWTSIKILIKRNRIQSFPLCIEKSIEYLAQSENTLFSSNALGVLFQLDQIEAINYFYKLIGQDVVNYLNGNEFNNYSVIENYEIIEKLFVAIYINNSDKFKFQNNVTLFNTYISNLSKAEDSYVKTQETLKKIKNSLSNENSDTGLFYINLLLDNSTNSYINSKSIPLSFKEALTKVEEIIN